MPPTTYVRRCLAALFLSVCVLAILAPAETRAQGVAITSITPPVAGYGESVTITGRGFGASKVDVRVGGVRAPVASATGHQATFRVPTGVPVGRTTVTVTNPGRHQATTDFEVSGKVALTLDETSRVTATVGSEGGMLTTHRAGVTFTLSIPPGALAGNETIAVTPVASITESPFNRLLGAVHFAPEGMRFIHPAVLRITFPETANLQGIAAFGAAGNGENLHLTPFGIDANGITIGVSHFSINGAGAGEAAVVAEVQCGTTLECSYTNALGQSLQSAIQEVCGADLCTSYSELAELSETIGLVWLSSELSLLQAWFGEVFALLTDEALRSDEELRAAGREFHAWRGWVNANACAGFSSCADVPEIDANIHVGDTSLAFAYFSALEHAAEECNDRRVSELTVEVEQLLLLGKGPLPDSETELRQNFACQLVITPQFPDSVELDDTVPFSVAVGIREGGASGAVTPASNQELTLAIADGCGVIDGGARTKTLFTDAQGVAIAQITISLPCIGSTDAIELVTEVFDITEGEVFALGRRVALHASIRRRLTLSPPSAVVAPGGTVTYAAEIDGASASATWTATGGTITPGPSSSATFTAGTSTGTFTVGATSVEDPTLSDTVLVHIESDDPPPPPPPPPPPDGLPCPVDEVPCKYRGAFGFEPEIEVVFGNGIQPGGAFIGGLGFSIIGCEFSARGDLGSDGKFSWVSVSNAGCYYPAGLSVVGTASSETLRFNYGGAFEFVGQRVR